MSTPRLLLLAVSAFALASCNPFHHGSSVQVSTKDASAANDAVTVACGNLAPPTL